MGDLSGKLGTLVIEPNSMNPYKTYSFYDTNLLLSGPYTSEFKWPFYKLSLQLFESTICCAQQHFAFSFSFAYF